MIELQQVELTIDHQGEFVYLGLNTFGVPNIASPF